MHFYKELMQCHGYKTKFSRIDGLPYFLNNGAPRARSSAINAMGGTHSRECNTIAKDIWQWCIDKQIWLTATHIPGTKNVEADRESRVFSDNKEWMIRPDIFRKISGGTPP